MPDKLDAEIDRIRELLLKALEVNRYSIRELERKTGVTQGLFRKPLGGDMRLSYRHVLQIVDAVGLPWPTFFRAAYPLPGEKAPSLNLGEARANEPAPATAPEAQASAPENTDGRRMLAALCRELIRLGHLDIREVFGDEPPPN